MKTIKFLEAEPHKNSEACKTLEYSFGIDDIDLGTATIEGRFPDKGYVYNEVSYELIYVLEGNGRLHFKNSQVEFSKGDAILIEPMDRYYFESKHCVISMACTPAWSPLQHKIEE